MNLSPFKFDVLVRNHELWSVTFVRQVDDQSRQGDQHFIWFAEAVADGRRHRSRWCIGGMLKIFLAQRNLAEERRVLSTMVRLFRRNVVRLLDGRDPLVALTAPLLEFFESVGTNNPLGRVQWEIESLLFALAQVPAMVDWITTKGGSEHEIPVPWPSEWGVCEPLLRQQVCHGALSEFYAEYDVLYRGRRLGPNRVDEVVTLARRVSRLGLLALAASDQPPTPELRIESR